MQKDIKNAMKRYIAKTDLNAHGFIRYDMVVKEVQCLYEIGRYRRSPLSGLPIRRE